MNYIINAKVATPYGPGIVQGKSAGGLLVRVQINDSNRDALSLSNCWTKRAVNSALFEIPESELK